MFDRLIRFVKLTITERSRPVFRSIVAGLFDAGFASLATFVVGLYAARVFDPAILGAYALAFAAFTLAANISAQLVFVPCQVDSLSLERSRRLSVLGNSLKLGLPVAFLSALAVSTWLLFSASDLPREISEALTFTAIACALVSPVQDHVRRMLHLADMSWAAATVSTVQFLGISAFVLLFVASGIPSYWIPFGALTAANLLSLIIGAVLGSRAMKGRDAARRFGIVDAVRSGRWLLIVVLLASGANFVAAALVTQLAGAPALGYAEAARICAQPIWVLVMGLRAVLGPRSMEAARARDRHRAGRISGGFAALVLLIGVAYVVAAGFDWWGNPLARLLPNAYAVPYLVLLWILGNIVIGLQSSPRAELIGGGREVGLAVAEFWSSLVRTAISATARVTDSFAMPVGVLLAALVRWLDYRRRAHRLYVEGEMKL
ncbi:MAG TPA: hypothetical protein VM737_12540 [Gemmatimonadota bacterium]|nr:hypothetical protein [Gemmatimonadota bacterium]